MIGDIKTRLGRLAKRNKEKKYILSDVLFMFAIAGAICIVYTSVLLLGQVVVEGRRRNESGGQQKWPIMQTSHVPQNVSHLDTIR